MRSKILSIGLALIPAVILISGQSSLGEAKGDDCRAKPDGTAPAGLHWYYRVDRANDRHCWYLHEQGMRVHSVGNPASRHSDVQTETAGEQIATMPPATPKPTYKPTQPTHEQSETSAEPPTAEFGARWVDMPRSVDLNAHGPVAESNGYAAEHAVEKSQEQLPPALADVSAANDEVQQDTGTQTHFGSISLAGAAILALLLVSEAFVRFARRSTWSLLRFNLRADSGLCIERSERAEDTAEYEPSSRMAGEAEPISRTQTGVNELRRLLQRAGTGLNPTQSFAPSRSVNHHEPADRTRAHSTFARLKSRSFGGTTWAPL